jgi:serine/threonine protein kinase
VQEEKLGTDIRNESGHDARQTGELGIHHRPSVPVQPADHHLRYCVLLLCASECINKKLVKVKSALDNVLEERNVLTMMKSNFVTNLKYALQDEDTLFLIMDLMLGGDLKFHLINAGRFTEKRARFYAAQVLLGLEHVHKLSIIYRDMKLENGQSQRKR